MQQALQGTACMLSIAILTLEITLIITGTLAFQRCSCTQKFPMHPPSLCPLVYGFEPKEQA